MNNAIVSYENFVFRYIPTRLWGFSGHVQTILHSLIGRVRCPWPIGGRVSLVLPDKSTLTYDLYEPVGNEHEGNRNSVFTTGKCVLLAISLMILESRDRSTFYRILFHALLSKIF